VRITHIGGPTALIEIGGWRLLTDPTFDEPGRRYNFGWGTSSRTVAGPAIPSSALGSIDAVLLSHDHHDDNLDAAGRALLPSAGVVVTTASGARRLGGSAIGLAPWETTRLGAGQVDDRDHGHAVPARAAAQPPAGRRRHRLRVRRSLDLGRHGAV
jgi:L-ascorbate metabolism protein UlaG (beta-lactamase superfamily)